MSHSARLQIRTCNCAGATCQCTTSEFNNSGGNVSAAASRRIPPGINSFLMQHGIDASNMYAARQKFMVAQVDEHLGSLNLKPSDRLAVKDCLNQLRLLA